MDAATLVRFRTEIIGQGVSHADANEIVIEILSEKDRQKRRLQAQCVSLTFDGMASPRWDGTTTMWRATPVR